MKELLNLQLLFINIMKHMRDAGQEKPTLKNLNGKLGAGVKQFLIAHPDMVPYKRNHSSQESYPETYFKDLFEKENINLIYHYRINTYELDFCDVNKKIDIEIDGEQHYCDLRIIESDKRRNEFLESQGWKIVRIRWAQFKKETEDHRKNEINKIKDLLK